MGDAPINPPHCFECLCCCACLCLHCQPLIGYSPCPFSVDFCYKLRETIFVYLRYLSVPCYGYIWAPHSIYCVYPHSTHLREVLSPFSTDGGTEIHRDWLAQSYRESLGQSNELSPCFLCSWLVPKPLYHSSSLYHHTLPLLSVSPEPFHTEELMTWNPVELSDPSVFLMGGREAYRRAILF